MRTPGDTFHSAWADNTLGVFLRTRREATHPGEVGLPAGPRRRTPGLRRGELADLAGVSIEYLTRLERGTDRRPSPQVLAALAHVLSLTEDEHVHLLRLVKADEGLSCTGPRDRTVRETVLALLERPGPAFVLDRCGRILARNPDTALLYPPDVDDVPLFVFTDPRARERLPEWDEAADEWATRVRAAADLGDAHVRVLAAELALRAGQDFVVRYERAVRVPAWSGTERRLHTDGRVHTWAYEGLEIPGTEEHRLMAYVPA